MTTYEAWERADKTEVTMSTLEGVAEQRRKGLMKGKWHVLHRIEAENWDEAMKKHHELMGFESYKSPMK